MAIDDNTSYELTGAQVKDLAAKIKAKADDNIFVGATSAAPGSKGIVPAPQAGDDTKFLSGDGTWKTAGGGADVLLYPDFVSSGGQIYFNGLFLDSQHTQEIGGYDLNDLWDTTGVKLIGGVGTIVKIYDGDEGSHEVSVDCGDKTIIYAIPSTVPQQKTPGMWPYGIAEHFVPWNAGANIQINNHTISATDTTYSDFTGATSSVAGSNGLVPAPAAGDEGKALHGDGTWKDTTAKLVEMSYGESNAWAKFIAAYNAGSIVYCRASSNANPASGSQTRKAFMAYVNNAASPTSVEFQYVRSVGSKTSSQPVDQVFVYTLTNASGGTWSVTTRDMAPKIAAGTGINVSYSNGTYTISLA